MKRKIFHALLLSITLTLNSCGLFTTMGNRLASGANEEADSIAYNMVTGMTEGLVDTSNQARINLLLQNIIAETRKGLDSTIINTEIDPLVDKLFQSLEQNLADPGFQDSLTTLISMVISSAGESSQEEISRMTARLLQQLDSKATSQLIARLREDLIGAQTTALVEQLLQRSLANALTDSTADNLRRQLLGPKTNTAIQAIVDSAMTTIVLRMNNDLNPALQTNLSFLQKNIREILATLGLITFGILAFVWDQRRRYLRISSLLSTQIFRMPNQESYDELTYRIKESAVDEGLEPTLRDILKENGLLGQEAWKNYQQKKRTRR